MATSPTVPMYAPDGTLGDIPYERMHEALNAGGKMAVNMTAPDGTPGVIPADKVQDAVKAGGKIVPYNLESQPEKQGFVSHVRQSLSQMGHAITDQPAPPTSVWEAIKQGASGGTGALPALVGAGKEFAGAIGRGHGIPYSAAAGASSLVGVNPQRMEQTAEQGDTAGVLGEAAVPAGTAALGYGASQALKALPNAQRAGAAFAEVKGAVGNVPINMSKVGDTALEIYTQSDRGASLPMAVRKLLNRTTKPGAAPLTYEEAKDFQSNISALSADEKMQMKPNTQRLLGQLNSELKDSLIEVADIKGKGQKLAGAFKEYHNAATLQGLSEKAIELGWKTLLGGALGATGYGLARKAYEAM